MKSPEELNSAVKTLKILSHPVRLNIVCRLLEAREMSAGQIAALQAEHASQSQVSQYLKLLREHGVVSARKDGHFVYYRLASPQIRTLMETMHRLYCSEP